MKLWHLTGLLSVVLFTGNAQAQVCGCKDPLATNYNASAACNDGSCVYEDVSVAPVSSFILPATISETSGLIKWNNLLWTHNDDTDINLYSLDPTNGNILQSYPLTGTVNTDWEEISQDANYVYVGDFGNNGNGNRTDLHILRIGKSSLLARTPVIDTIHFSYANQHDFTPTGSNNTNFDCEAFIVTGDSLYLFTKQWVSHKTSVYSLPKTPGTYTAHFKSTFDVQGLITGAVTLEYKKLVVLCGYSSSLQPFLYLLYDFNGTDYFGGNKRKVSLSLSFHQVEGIATSDGFTYYISNEKFTQSPFINVSQKLQVLDLSSLFGTYITSIPGLDTLAGTVIYPNPATDFITLKTNKNLWPSIYNVVSSSGRTVLKGTLTAENPSIRISDLPAGLYLLKIGKGTQQSFRVIKR